MTCPHVYSACSIQKPFQETLASAIARIMNQVGQSSVGEASRKKGKCIHGEVTTTVCGLKSGFLRSGKRVWCDNPSVTAS